MGIRYKKSLNFGPVRLNASKTGFGWSVGVPGARYTKLANGRTRMTTSIPGTGISWVEESKKQKQQPTQVNTGTERATKMTRWDLFCLIVGEIFKVLLRIGLAILFIVLLCSSKKD